MKTGPEARAVESMPKKKEQHGGRSVSFSGLGRRGGHLGLLGDPFARERLQIIEALEQVGARGRNAVTIGAVRQQTSGAQFLDPGVERVGGDAAYAVLQKAKRLGMAVFQRPHHAHGVTGFQQFQKLTDGCIFFGAHGEVSW